MRNFFKPRATANLTSLFAALALGTGLSMTVVAKDLQNGVFPPAPDNSKTNLLNAAESHTDDNRLKDGSIVHLKTGIAITKEQMIADIAEAQVIYISELHDNLAAHEVQLDIIRALDKKFPGRIVVGMETFRESTQPALDAIHKDHLSREDFNRLFDQDWIPDWRPAYQPLLDYVRERAIPVIGLPPSQEIESIVSSGQTSPDVPEMDENDPHHKAYYMPFFIKHSMGRGSPEEMYRMMVLWDEAMANNVARFLANPENRGKKLVVIAGEGHIQYGFGIPKRAHRRIPHTSSTVLPLIEYDLDENSPLRAGDYVWKVPYEQLKVEETAQPVTAPRPAP